ncbi:MAG TPA: ankyrin repeat domain-containing protein [Bryobacteraceae bacterium]|jgi:ankyrin repeat protein|nr:ankyrin repeat domain-containing protein [Bryobacteraceae bacterium]
MSVGPRLLIFLVAFRLWAAESPVSEPLFQAIQKADTARVRQLLSRGLSPNAQDAEGTPALMAAALYADADCVQVLLERGANPNAANAVGATALMWAIPDLAKVKLLLAHGADVNARSTNLQRTPLLVAASYPGTVGILQLLLAKGADIHAKDRGKIHALGRATLTADVSVVRFLIEHGCDPNEPGYSSGRRFARHDLATFEYLMSKGAKIDRDALTYASTWHDPGLIEKWIGMGVDVNARTGPYGRTALMTAASSEQAGPATLRMLLEKGADPNAEDSEGERPLDWAMYRHDQGRIEVLEQFGAKRGKGPRQQIYPAPETPAAPDPDPVASLSRGVTLLLSAAPSVFQKRGCISCHSQALPAELAAVARRKGVAVNEEMAATNLNQILAFSKTSAEAAMQGDELAGNSTTLGYIMAAFAAERRPLDKITAAYSHLAASMQMPDGRWLGNGVSRPPEEGGLITTTAMAVRAMALYPLAGPNSARDEKLRRAQQWLLAAEPHSAEERSMRLMGLVWTKAARPRVDAAMREVMAQQRDGGGWSQADPLAPDAYATGLSLYALREGGMPVTAQVYRKGIAFLLANQYADGSWLVKTRSYPVQPYFESGYPYGRNQWISAAGASWASLAIAHTLPDAKP